jgi:ubiquinone/menaquinone biosynthesis C-methylase UbiE
MIPMKTYDDIAEWYDQWIGQEMSEDPFFPAVEAFIGEIKGLRICDLACGQGRVARYLANRGAHVVGIDLSTKLLSIARHYEGTEPHGITYLQADARSLDGEDLGLFDGVVCFMALMDIADLAPTLQSVVRILQPGGWFVFSILHPCFHTSQSGSMQTQEGTVRIMSKYFVEGYWRSGTRPGPPGKVGAYHRMLSTYVNTLTAVGLTLEHLSEPPVSNGNRPVWQEVPCVLVAGCRKPKNRAY